MVEELISNETKQSSVTSSHLLCLCTNQRIKSAVERLPTALIQTPLVRQMLDPMHDKRLAFLCYVGALVRASIQVPAPSFSPH